MHPMSTLFVAVVVIVVVIIIIVDVMVAQLSSDKN